MPNYFNTLRNSVIEGLVSKSAVEKALENEQIDQDQWRELCALCKSSKLDRASAAIAAADRDFRGVVSRAGLGGYLTISPLTEKGVILSAPDSKPTEVSPKQLAKMAAGYRNLFAAMAAAEADDDETAEVAPLSAVG